jgi:hypothetical protein
MVENVRNYLKKHPNTLVLIFGVLSMYVLVIVIVDKKLHDLENRISVQASKQRALLTAISETTARNDADTVAKSIVQDCTVTERSRFDAQLARLNEGLPKSELDELSRLYDRCGKFFAERKSVMVARLSREIEVYASYVDQLKTVSNKKNVASYQVELWRELAAAEKRQSESFGNLAILQGEIIELLREGKKPSALEVRDTLTEVAKVQQALSAANIEAGGIRKSLVSL